MHVIYVYEMCGCAIKVRVCVCVRARTCTMLYLWCAHVHAQCYICGAHMSIIYVHSISVFLPKAF